MRHAPFGRKYEVRKSAVRPAGEKWKGTRAGSGWAGQEKVGERDAGEAQYSPRR